VLDINALPTDVTQLQRLLIEHHELVATQSVDLRTKQRQIEHLKFQLAKLRRFRFGQSSERLEGIEQMILSLEELKASVVQAAASPTPDAAVPDKGQPARRKHLPEHFERIDNTIEPNECTCPDCGGPLGLLGTDTAEVLEVKTVSFTVTRHIRPKRRCSSCAVIVQAPAPSRPIEKSFAGASLLALILSWKYAFHLPLYRQCQIFAHAGLTLSRTTLMQWVGASSELLGPLVAALAKHVLSAPNINADDTPIKVLAPGAGKTKRGHLWTYVRDGRPWGSTDPPAVWYRYSPSWHGKYPQKHLAGFNGKLQVDAYAGFEPLFVATKPDVAASVVEIACFAHVRRKWFDLYKAHQSPLAKEALERIGQLYGIEKAIRGQSAEDRLAQRQLHAAPLLLYGAGIFGVWLIAYKDIRLSTRVMLVLEVVSMALILMLGIIVMIKRHTLVDTAQFNFANMNFAGLKAGLILAIFSFVGYESATTLGEEAKNPHVNIPRSVLLSALISGTFFMLTAYIAVMGFEGLHGSLAESTAPFNDLARGFGVEAFGVLISVGAVISLFACALASVNAAARIIFSMSHGGIFTAQVGRAHSTNHTPHLAVSLCCIMVFAMPAVLLLRGTALLDIFNDLSTIATFGFLVAYVLISIAAPVFLRRIGAQSGASVLKSLAAILFMVPPVVATVYPLPSPPADRFSWYFAVYVGVGAIWYLYLLSRAKTQ